MATLTEQLHQAEARQVVLMTTMAKSDAHATKCAKLGISFAETYPEDYAEYCNAREEYNENERTISTLKEQIYLEEQEQASHHEDIKMEE